MSKNYEMVIPGKVAVIFGLRGSGKSTLMRYLANSVGVNAFVYDTVKECESSARYVYYQPVMGYDVGEFTGVVRQVIDSHKFSALLIDEANRFCPSKPAPLPPTIAELNDQCRHYKLGVIYIARRPSQLNQDITELADYIIVYHLTGKRDVQYLNDIMAGLGDDVRRLQPYWFVFVPPNRAKYTIVQPITPV